MNTVLSKSQDFYQLLNIKYDSSIGDIKSAYKRLALIYHPDVSKERDCIEKFKNIVKAYSVLKDPVLRADYDKGCRGKKIYNIKINFEYYYQEATRRTDEVWNSIKIFFKNISASSKLFIKKENNSSNILFDTGYILPKEIFDMPIQELEDRLLYSQNPYVRINSAVALGYKKEKKALPTLESSFLDSNYEVRKAVIWAIGNLKMKKSLTFLNTMFGSIHSVLKIEILKAVYKIVDGKGALLNNLFVMSFNDELDEVKIGGLNLFLNANKKVLYKDVKHLLNSSSAEVRDLLDKLFDKKMVIK